MTSRRTHVPVLIVGGGPVGLALAGELAWRGVQCRLVERTDGAITQPKMDLIGPRTMEFCRRWGIADQVRNCPYNADLPQDNVWLESLTGYEFGREVFPSPRLAKTPPQSPVRRERCPQDMFDPILRRWVETLPTATLDYETELLTFKSRPDGVTTRLRGPDGTEETVEADYIVGADGGASTVRQILGIGMAGTPALTYTTNVVFRCPDFWSLHDKKKGYRFIFIGPEGTWSTLVAIDGYDRYRFSIIGNEVKETLSTEQVSAMIVRAMGRPFDFEIQTIVPWVRRELVADSYGGHRAFIVGDAAHLNSPTGAFGMNTGMQDAVDLGWKLWARLSGWAGQRLLGSYEIERRPVALRNVEEASANLRRMLTPRLGVPAHLFEAVPEGDAVRRDFGESFSKLMKHEWFTLHIHLGYRYDGSPVIVPDGTPAPNDAPMTYSQSARPGSRGPHVWLEPDRSTLDLFGRGYVLLRFDQKADVTAIEQAAARRGVPLETVSIDHPEARKLYAAALVLVRPDGFVCWRRDAIGDDADAVLAIVSGQQHAPAREATLQKTSSSASAS